jgi:hypothetical protein
VPLGCTPAVRQKPTDARGDAEPEPGASSSGPVSKGANQCRQHCLMPFIGAYRKRLGVSAELMCLGFARAAAPDALG